MTSKASPSMRTEIPALFSPPELASEAGQEKDARKTLPGSESEDPRAPQVLSRSMSLFEIDESLSALMESAVDAAAENNGEIPAELQQALLDYCEAFGQKVDNIARYIRSQEFEAGSAKAEIQRLEQTARSPMRVSPSTGRYSTRISYPTTCMTFRSATGTFDIAFNTLE